MTTLYNIEMNPKKLMRRLANHHNCEIERVCGYLMFSHCNGLYTGFLRESKILRTIRFITTYEEMLNAYKNKDLDFTLIFAPPAIKCEIENIESPSQEYVDAFEKNMVEFSSIPMRFSPFKDQGFK